METSNELPVEVASVFFTGLNEPKPTTIDFSLDGQFFVSAHSDDALRVIDVQTLHHTDTIECESYGIHDVKFTQSNNVVIVAPRHPLDGHLHLLNLETAQFFTEVAYINDGREEMKPIANTPVYATVAQCPVSDTFASVVTSQRRLALFNPFISGAIACTKENTLSGHHPVVTFSHDGHILLTGDDEFITLYDRRKLIHSEPLCHLANSSIFTWSKKQTRCKGIELNYNGKEILATSACGEVVVYDWVNKCTLVNYFRDDARRHFAGAGDALGARYLSPFIEHSHIVQPTSSMLGGRHLLVYEAHDQHEHHDHHHHDDENDNNNNTNNNNISTNNNNHIKNEETVSVQGSLRYELQSKDSDVPVGLAINRFYRLAAVAARSVTWWSFNE